MLGTDYLCKEFVHWAYYIMRYSDRRSLHVSDSLRDSKSWTQFSCTMSDSQQYKLSALLSIYIILLLSIECLILYTCPVGNENVAHMLNP